jgi:hypothetical protein
MLWIIVQLRRVTVRRISGEFSTTLVSAFVPAAFDDMI